MLHNLMFVPFLFLNFNENINGGHVSRPVFKKRLDTSNNTHTYY